MPRALITTIPFGERDATPLQLLQAAGIDFTINPLERKVTEFELSELIVDFDILIVGTELVTGDVMAQEQPAAVNAALAKWLAAKLPDYWKA